MKTAEQIVDATLSVGNRRSVEYRPGMLAVMRFRLTGEHIQIPYREGSAQFDAFFAGIDRGHFVWREMIPAGGQQ